MEVAGVIDCVSVFVSVHMAQLLAVSKYNKGAKRYLGTKEMEKRRCGKGIGCGWEGREVVKHDCHNKKCKSKRR